MYEVLTFNRKGKGWFALRDATGVPARFNGIPGSLEEAQDIIAAEGYRPTNRQVLSKYATRFPEINLFHITLIAASWSDAHQKFFAENGVIDTIYVPKPHND